MKKTGIATPGAAGRKAPALKAPQSIVHIKHRISLQQYKYWVLLLQELRQLMEEGAEPDQDGFYSMSMPKLAELIGYTPNKSEVWNDLLALKNETIAFNVLNKDREKEKYGAGFISEWKVSNSYIRFKFPSFLENVMRGLDEPKAMFALINWNIFNHFTGKYEAIIYKLCKDYISSPGSRTPDMTLQQFREYVGLKDSEYIQFKELNRWVINGPVSKINESDVSDISVIAEFKRDGRKVIGLYFKVAHKRQTSLQFQDLEEESIFRFAKVPIPPELQQRYLSKRTQEQILLCIERANEYGESQERAGKPVNYGGLYRTAINEGWHEEHAVKKATSEKKKAVKEAEIKQAREAEETEKQKEERARRERAEAWARFEALTEEEKRAIAVEFESQAAKPDLSFYERKGFDCAPFRIFLRKRYFG